MNDNEPNSNVLPFGKTARLNAVENPDLDEVQLSMLKRLDLIRSQVLDGRVSGFAYAAVIRDNNGDYCATSYMAGKNDLRLVGAGHILTRRLIDDWDDGATWVPDDDVTGPFDPPSDPEDTPPDENA